MRQGLRVWFGRRLAPVLGIVALLVAVGGPARAAEPLHIVATTGMIADAVTQVGGDRVEVVALMGPGVDPHLYRPTASDIARMARADAVFYHGLNLEAQLREFLERLGSRVPVVALADGLPHDRLHENPDYANQFDPHVWMDPRLWRGVVIEAADALSRLDPAGAEIYAANADAYLAEVDALADYGDRVLSSVPEGARVLVTAHDAFGYFGAAHGFEVLGIQGISTNSEAGVRQIESLVDTLVSRDIGAIFIESSVSDRNVRALIEGAAARGHTVKIGGELYSDAMGTPGTYEGTYIGMIDHNVTIITDALGGEAPDGGMNGRLAVAGL
ncbi:zinc ABC transporter substrate-binding protein [Aureimonas altamirensis]|uniref:metal ABC transporter solute-binding protein, Zn/Mn family n=1 Tax=Aureimonas altamirensis TaxID=370622 RepID=UPI001E353AFB|nr:zinc ABC transporter substrate-binding protein [Aureimonas altamirensis]UHD47119.1 zinc ABC transporter substrate-binding protein [Aureimonas altamirensis]